MRLPTGKNTANKLFVDSHDICSFASVYERSEIKQNIIE